MATKLALAGILHWRRKREIVTEVQTEKEEKEMYLRGKRTQTKETGNKNGRSPKILPKMGA